MGDSLKKCQFCGGKARYVYSMPLNYVECTKCKALGATIVDAYEQRDGKKAAIEAWNLRADGGWISVENGVYWVLNASGAKLSKIEGATSWNPLPETPKEEQHESSL